MKLYPDAPPLSPSAEALRCVGGHIWVRRIPFLATCDWLFVSLIVPLASALPLYGWIFPRGIEYGAPMFFFFRGFSILPGIAVFLAGWTGALLGWAVLVVQFVGIAWDRYRLAARARAMVRGRTGARHLAQGAIVATVDEMFPTLVREGDLTRRAAYRLTVSTQAFVVAGEGGSWLVDTQYLEVFGGVSSPDHNSAVSREVFEAYVGSEAVLAFDAADRADAPPWYLAIARTGAYRAQALRRAVGTRERPIRVWVRTRAGPPERLPAPRQGDHGGD